MVKVTYKFSSRQGYCDIIWYTEFTVQLASFLRGLSGSSLNLSASLHLAPMLMSEAIHQFFHMSLGNED
jgi:hypothetical protein